MTCHSDHITRIHTPAHAASQFNLFDHNNNIISPVDTASPGCDHSPTSHG